MNLTLKFSKKNTYHALRRVDERFSENYHHLVYKYR